ncbi:hypothetical protein [Bdellovibrio sp. KM01]|uniref:hypothetical protein n=1 Tax=Bdellovibrio sp. KM01 TaxID=2748865 RepID=UPI0015EA029B|nr:hypothetical protein [Bdellovibrio sp. KM01]QLY25686.1 hypothetical protein HW988_01135 [Bdellovibrio sp. KM01]
MENNFWGSVLNGFGSILKGVAAVLAVCFAKQPAQDYFDYLKSSQLQIQLQFQQQLQKQAQEQKQKQEQEQNNSQKIDIKIDIHEAQKQVSELIQQSNSPTQFAKSFEKIPSNLPRKNGDTVGLVIAEEYRAEVKKELSRAPTDREKARVIEDFWNKSLKSESKDVNLKLGVEK